MTDSPQVAALKEIVHTTNGQDHPQQDLIVLSSGAWDRLYHFSSFDDKQAVIDNVKELAVQITELQKIGYPVAWLIPTTINTNGTAEQSLFISSETSNTN